MVKLAQTELEGLAKRDASGNTTPEEAEILRSDENIEAFVDFLDYLEATLAVQIEAFDVGKSRKTPEWRTGANLFWLRVGARLKEIRPLLRERDRRLREAARLRKEAELSAAIVNHRAQVLNDDLEPSDADRLLWAAVQ